MDDDDDDDFPCTPLFSRCLVSARLFQPKVICSSDEFVISERKIKALKSKMINN